MTKRFTHDLARQAIVAEYTIRAQAARKSFAQWEVTRVFPGGLTFYPTGIGAPTSGTFALPAFQTAAGCTWLKYPTATVSSGQRLIADGSGGWLAHVAVFFAPPQGHVTREPQSLSLSRLTGEAGAEGVG